MIRRPPRSTRTDTSFPTRRSSDLSVSVADSLSEGSQRVQRIIEDKLAIVRLRQIAMVRVPWLIPLKESDMMPSRRQSAKCRSEEHTSELQSLMRISYAVFCLKKKIRHRMYLRLYTFLQASHNYSNYHQRIIT